MAVTTLPSFVKTIDNLFTTTWYEVQAQAEDNILLATVLTAFLKLKGCFKTQVGGTNVERTVKYAVPTPAAVVKGDILPSGELENRTAAFWTFRNAVQHVQRSLLDDTANRGEFRIVDYVADRLEDATEALKQKQETDLLRAHVTDETGKEIQGFNDMLPPVATRNTGTYGGINRPTTFASDLPTVGNIWWTPRYQQLTANPEVNLLTDMKKFFNTVQNSQEMPDGIITTKTMFELYLEWGLDQTQIIGSSKMLELGFITARYNGADLMWTPNLTVEDLLFINSRRIECVYDPGLWFDMTPWQPVPQQAERIAYIFNRWNMITKQPRRHGRLYT